MQLYWTSDGFASCEVGTYRIILHNDLFAVHWLPPGYSFWQPVQLEDTLAAARMTASVHAGLPNHVQRTSAVKTKLEWDNLGG